MVIKFKDHMDFTIQILIPITIFYFALESCAHALKTVASDDKGAAKN